MYRFWIGWIAYANLSYIIIPCVTVAGNQLQMQFSSIANVLRLLFYSFDTIILYSCSSPVVLQQHYKAHCTHTAIHDHMNTEKTNSMVSVVCAQIKTLCMASTYILFHMLNTNTHTHTFIDDSIYFSFWMHQQRINVLWLAHSTYIEFEQMDILRFQEIDRCMPWHALVENCTLPHWVCLRSQNIFNISELWFSMLTIMTMM